jgi:hypothetical protein
MRIEELRAPPHLDYQTLSDYDQKMHVRPIAETAYLIGQKGHTKWPSYQIRTHLRCLPQVTGQGGEGVRGKRHVCKADVLVGQQVSPPFFKKFKPSPDWPDVFEEKANWDHLVGGGVLKLR